MHLLPPHEPYTARREFVDLFDDGWTPAAKPPHFFSEKHSDAFLNQQRREYDEYLARAVSGELSESYPELANSTMGFIEEFEIMGLSLKKSLESIASDKKHVLSDRAGKVIGKQ